jgi:hypothetical protein
MLELRVENGVSTIVANNGLVSANPTDPSL